MSHGTTHTTGHGPGSVHKPHFLPLRIYLGVWIGLLILTVVTVAVSYQHFGSMNIVVAMGIATVKATLVTLFFMHLKYDEHFNVLVFLASLLFLSMFFILTLADTAERGKVDPVEGRVIVPVPARPELMEALGGGEGGAAGHGGAPAGGHSGETGHGTPTGSGGSMPPGSEGGAPAAEAPDSTAPADTVHR